MKRVVVEAAGMWESRRFRAISKAAQEYRELSLFLEERPLPEDAVDSIQVRLSSTGR
jgi:hypothetical protein